MLRLHSQPKGFSIFFLTEMWERYGFYIIQTLLIFYLVKHLHFGDKEAYVIVGSFTALAYINSIFGGNIADKIIGSSRAIILGGILLSIGYSILGSDKSHLNFPLNLSLSFITVGTGLLKPNLSGLLGSIYEKGDIRKEDGYTLYYVGLYIGVLGGCLFGGYLHTRFGWHGAFYSAALAGIIATSVALYGRFKYRLMDASEHKMHSKQYLLALGYIILLITVSFFVFHSESLASFYYIVIACCALGFLIYCIIIHNGQQRNRFIAFLLLVLIAVVYWGIFFQQFFSISLAASRTTITSIPYSSLPTAESVGIIVFGPLINLVWAYFRRRKAVSISLKFSLGLLFNSLSFLFLAAALFRAHALGQHLDVWIIIAAYLIIAIGELCLSPTSLYMVTTLIPEKYTGIMMGVSLLSIGFGGGKLASVLASFSAMDQSNTSLPYSEQVYMHAFLNYFIFSAIAFVIALALSRYIDKLIGPENSG